MKNKMLNLFVVLVLLSMCVSGQETVCAIYFTGIGCPHCAQTDPYLFGEVLYTFNQSFILIEYEVYQERENPAYVAEYDQKFGVGYGIPKVVFSQDEVIDGDRDIVNNIKSKVEEKTALGEGCLLLDLDTTTVSEEKDTCLVGSKIPFEEVDFNKIVGKPKIWMGNKVLFKVDKEANASSDLLRKLLISDNVSKDGSGYAMIEPVEIPFSGGGVKFSNAIKVDGWILQWNEGGNHEKRMSYSFDYYMEWIPWIVVTGGIIVLILMRISEKKKGGT